MKTIMTTKKSGLAKISLVALACCCALGSSGIAAAALLPTNVQVKFSAVNLPDTSPYIFSLPYPIVSLDTYDNQGNHIYNYKSGDMWNPNSLDNNIWNASQLNNLTVPLFQSTQATTATTTFFPYNYQTVGTRTGTTIMYPDLTYGYTCTEFWGTSVCNFNKYITKNCGNNLTAPFTNAVPYQTIYISLNMNHKKSTDPATNAYNSSVQDCWIGYIPY